VQDPLAPEDRYDGPTLFILGGHSPFVQPEDHARIRRHFPAAHIEILPESGHNPHLEAREAFVAAVLRDAPEPGPAAAVGPPDGRAARPPAGPTAGAG